jgi:hypothetical protein
LLKIDRKNSARVLSVLTHSVKQMTGQLLSLLLSVYVIHYSSRELWGGFVASLLYVSVSLLILSWGSKDFLLREFSKSPAKIATLFYTAFNTRLVLLLLSMALTFALFPISQSINLSVWILGGYIAQSLEVFWMYHRDYVYSVALEILAFLWLLLMLDYAGKLSAEILLKWYGCYQALRALLYVGLYRRILSQTHFTVDWQFFAATGSFFLLSLSGFLQSRADFVIIALYEKPNEVGIYQVLNTYFILIHAIGTFLILPFLKNIYRLQSASIDKIQRQLVWIAPFIVTASLVALHFILHFAYQITLDFWYYAIGFFITLPPYFYAVKIIRLFRDNRQQLVFWVGIKAIAINSGIAFVLLRQGFGLKGALFAAAVAQIFTAYQYLNIDAIEKQGHPVQS